MLRPLEGTEFRLCEVVGGGPLDGELLINLDDVPAWLDTIDPAELAPEGRAKLEAYKQHFALLKEQQNRAE